TRRNLVGRTTCGLVFICGHAVGERTASCGRTGKQAPAITQSGQQGPPVRPPPLGFLSHGKKIKKRRSPH
ncbi:unnamed protein product, partial [Ectocarpus sp. 12 AP-2014]